MKRPKKKPREVWRKLTRYDGLYEVSNLGRIRSRPDGSGPQHEWLHRLILEAFKGPCPPGHQAAHLDGDGHNNVPGNLKWKTPLENHADILRHGRRPMGSKHWSAATNEKEVRKIRRMRAAGKSLGEIGRAFPHLKRTHVWQLVQNTTWRHVR